MTRSDIRLRRRSALGIALAAFLSAANVHAQEAPRSEVSITPYLWIPGFEGTVGAAADLPPVPVSADFPGVFDRLSGFAMVAAEARYERFGVLGDFMSLSLAGDHNLTFQQLPALGGRIKVSTDDATVAGFWRAYQSDRFTADLIAGARYTEVKNQVSISVGGRTVSGSASLDGWDPIVGVRGSMRTGPRGSLSAYGDYGGGSFADSVWQVLGAYNYSFTGHVAGSVGWRFYGVNLSRGDNHYDITLMGPLVGARFRF